MSFWIEKAWGANAVDEAVFGDVEIAINETLSVVDKYSAFWTGNETGKILEVQHRENSLIMYLFDRDTEEVNKTTLNDWDEVRYFFGLFFESKFEEIENLIKNRI